jgi:putative flippase GtrA
MPYEGLSFWQALRRLLFRNSMAALLATIAEFALYNALVWSGIAPPPASALGCVFGGVVNFFINRRWTFESREATWPQAWRYALVSGAGAGISYGGMELLLRTGLDHRVVWALTHLITSWAWHLPLQRFFVFARRAGSRLRHPKGQDRAMTDVAGSAQGAAKAFDPAAGGDKTEGAAAHLAAGGRGQRKEFP